jgi:hypothetical protein
LRQAAADLVANVLLVRSKLRRKHAAVRELPGSEVPVAWTGSVIGKMPIVREAFFAGLRNAAPAMPVETTETVALNGALWRARASPSNSSKMFGRTRNIGLGVALGLCFGAAIGVAIHNALSVAPADWPLARRSESYSTNAKELQTDLQQDFPKSPRWPLTTNH